jgi:8-oxo-dGTP pyrophosphatase MutT (NUDIX family)
MKYKIYFELPKDFKPDVRVAGCFCEWNDKLLYLKRHADKQQGNMWGLPAGKIEEGEDPRSAAVREVYEEVGIRLDPDRLQEVIKAYLKLENVSYVFHAFRIRLQKAPSIILEPGAHTEAKWLTIGQALKLSLIAGGKELLEYYQANFSSS